MMTALRTVESANWVPEYEFEVWSLGLDCKRCIADCCRELAMAAGNSEDARKLKEMLICQEDEIRNLTSRINNMIDNMLGDFYSNGGQALKGSLPDEIKQQVRVCLNQIEDHEDKIIETVNSNLVKTGAEYVEEQIAFYRNMFSRMAELYPEGQVKRALSRLFI